MSTVIERVTFNARAGASLRPGAVFSGEACHTEPFGRIDCGNYIEIAASGMWFTRGVAGRIEPAVRIAKIRRALMPCCNAGTDARAGGYECRPRRRVPGFASAPPVPMGPIMRKRLLPVSIVSADPTDKRNVPSDRV